MISQALAMFRAPTLSPPLPPTEPLPTVPLGVLDWRGVCPHGAETVWWQQMTAPHTATPQCECEPAELDEESA